jgi:RNA-directed DNA polymerase
MSLRPSRRLQQSDDELRARFASLRTAFDVADLLDVKYELLSWHLWQRPKSLRYRRFDIRKRRGGVRRITAPTGGLAFIQSKLAQVLAAVYVPRPSTHGFVRSKSIVSNAREHVGRSYILNVDLEDFFPSIHFGRVRGLFAKWPYKLPLDVATTLAQACFAGEEGLPQGAPTSPVVANMLCAGMDAAFERLAAKHRCTYTRYSDDIVISTTRTRFPRDLAFHHLGSLQLGPGVVAVLQASGFTANARKIRLQGKFERQEVTGLTTNKFVNVPRRYVRQIRAMLHAWEVHGEAAAESAFRSVWDRKHRSPWARLPSYAEVLAGKLSFLGMVRGRQERLYSKLVLRARRQHVRFGSLPTRNDAVLVVKQIGVGVRGSRQGTGFALEGIGFVTAAHVVLDEQEEEHGHMEVCRAWAPAAAVPLGAAPPVFERLADFAVFRLPFARLPRLTVGDSGRVQTGDRLTVLGFPHWAPGHEIQETSATVTGHELRRGTKRIVLDLPVQLGNSGGPVLNSLGEVVGIVVTSSNDGRHPNSVVPIAAVIQRARELGIDLKSATLFEHRAAVIGTAPAATAEQMGRFASIAAWLRRIWQFLRQ